MKFNCNNKCIANEDNILNVSADIGKGHLGIYTYGKINVELAQVKLLAHQKHYIIHCHHQRILLIH